MPGAREAFNAGADFAQEGAGHRDQRRGLVLGEEAVRGQLDKQLKSYVGAQAAEGIQSMA